MSFRNAATVVVARIFKLLDSNGFTRIFLTPFVRQGFAGYALAYDDPAFNLATENAGLWFRDGSTDPVTQLFATSKQAPPTELTAWVEVQTVESLSDCAVSIFAGSTPKTASIVVDATNTKSSITLTCEELSPWFGFAAGGMFGANVQDAGGADNVCQWGQVGDTVRLRGTLAVVGAGVAAGGTIFTIPAPATRRPPATVHFLQRKNGNLYVCLDIASTGVCTINAGGAALAAGDVVSLDGIFYASNT